MPIDTRVDGDPAAIRAAARRLRDELAFEVAGSARALSLSRTDAAAGWEGVAGSAFRDRMATAAVKADALRGDLTGTAGAFDELAGHLDDVRQRMRTAQEIAADAGLVVTGEQILEPGPAPAVPGLPANNAATPDMVTARNDAIEAAAVNALQWEAYRTAAGDVALARERERAALEAVRAHHAQVLGTPVVRSSDVTAAARTQTPAALGISASAGGRAGVVTAGLVSPGGDGADGLGTQTAGGAGGMAGVMTGPGAGFGAAVSGGAAGLAGAATSPRAGVGAAAGGVAAGLAGAAAASGGGSGAATGAGAGAVAGGLTAGNEDHLAPNASKPDAEPAEDAVAPNAPKPGAEPAATAPPSAPKPAAEPTVPAPPPAPAPRNG